jgi:hypothetical protein
MNLKFRGFAPDSPCLCHTTEFLRQMPTPESHSLWQFLNAESEPHLHVPLVLINSVNAPDDKLQVISSDLLNGHLEHFALKQLYLCDAASANEHTYSTQFQMYRCITSQLLQELEYRICLYIEIHHLCMCSQAPISFLFPITLCRNL